MNGAALACAQVAVKYFDHPTAVLMTAIAGAESRWNPGVDGDQLGEAINCGGFSSFGLWQIHTAVWHDDLVARFGAPSDYCQQAQWLKNPENNALAAQMILKAQGPQAWTTFNIGAYKMYLTDAKDAVFTAAPRVTIASVDAPIYAAPIPVSVFDLRLIRHGSVLPEDRQSFEDYLRQEGLPVVYRR